MLVMVVWIFYRFCSLFRSGITRPRVGVAVKPDQAGPGQPPLRDIVSVWM